MVFVIHASSYYATEEDNWLVVETFSIKKYKEIDWWNTNKNGLILNTAISYDFY